MEWNHETVLQLIELYRQCPELWDPKDNNYHMRNKKHDAWVKIANELHCDAESVKTKLNSLLSSYRREKGKMRKSTGTGKGRREIYISNWFAFEAFGFLMDKDKPTHHINTENSSDEDDNTNEASSLDGITEVDDDSNAGTEDQDINPATEGQGINEELNTETPKKKPQKRKLFLSPKKPINKKKKKEVDDAMVEHAYDILKSVSKNTERDECTIYSEHVASQLRQLDKRTRTITIHKLDNILFEAKMGSYASYSYGQPSYSNNDNSHPSTSSASSNSYIINVPSPGQPYSYSPSPHPSPGSLSALPPTEGFEATLQTSLQDYVPTFMNI